MKKIFLILPLFFTSCYFKDFSAVTANNLNERVFENSAQGRVVNRDGDIDADIKAIYLSDITSKFKNYDVFLLSIYFFDNKIDGLNNVDYSIRLNGIKPFKIDKINKNSNIISQIKLLNPWFNNYIVYFKKLDTEKFNLSFGYGHYEKLQLSLIKGRGELRDYPTIADKLYN